MARGKFMSFINCVRAQKRKRYYDGTDWGFVGKPNGFQGVVVEVTSLINDVHSPMDYDKIHEYWDVVY